MQVIGPFPVAELAGRFFQIIFSPWVFTGLSLAFISALFWLTVLARVDLSFAYPMVSLGYVLVVLLSFLIFKENVTLIRWIGVLVICLGVYLVSRS